MGTWFSLLNNWETFVGQLLALALGLYSGAEHLKVRRPHKRGQRTAQVALEAPRVAREAPQPPVGALSRTREPVLRSAAVPDRL